MSVIITGSLAFDHIMNFKGKFSDYILPERIHQLNLSFAVDVMRKERGGCAGNIAYNLHLLSEKPIILSSAGEDFTEYKLWLDEQGIDTRFIKEIYGESTAVGFGVTDEIDNQIWAFYPGAMKYNTNLSLAKIIKPEIKQETATPSSRFAPPRFGSSRGGTQRLFFGATQPVEPKKEEDEDEERPLELPTLPKEDIKLLMIAPNQAEAMMNFVHEAKTLYVPYIFDPGMQIPHLNRDNLLKAIDGAEVLIGNDYEIGLIEDMLNAQAEHLLKLVKYLIITKGPQGSVIYHEGKTYEIPPVIPQTLEDPTGAGDAYRAGIIYGLLHKLPIEIMGRIGSLLATYTVEKYGTTTHEFKIIEFKKRYLENFGEKLEL